MRLPRLPRCSMIYHRPPATWPLWRRELWGQRSNDLEATGVPWQEAERQAFEEASRGTETDRRGVEAEDHCRGRDVRGQQRRIYLVWDQAIAAGELPPRRGKWQHRTATPAKSHHGPRIEPYRSRVVKNPPPPPPRDEQPHLRVWTLKEICQVWTQRYSDAWSGKGNTFMLKATI